MRRQLAVLLALCQLCSRPCAHTVAVVRRWFALFFIPLFPVGTRNLTVCSMCAGALAIDKDYAQHLGQEAVRQRSHPARVTRWTDYPLRIGPDHFGPCRLVR